VNKLTLNLAGSWLPKEWEEVSREGTEMQLTLKLGHIDPENKANPILTSGNPVANVGGETVSVHGIDSRGTMTKFFESMTKMAETGWMKGYTPAKIDDIRKQFNAVRNEKYDTVAFVVIIRYENEAGAKQALEQQLALRTGGFGDLKIPGMNGQLTSYLDNEQVKQAMSAEQQKLVKEMLAKATTEYKNKTAEAGMKSFITTELGYPAVMTEMDNPEYLRQEEAKKKPKYVPDKSKFRGGGFDPLAGKGVLPKKPKSEPPSPKIKSCVAMQVGRYLLSGDLLAMLNMLPSGETFHESLTKTNTYIEKENVEGQMYTTKHLIPVASNYASEGYANQEQAKEILKKIISSLKG
jgi:hypothetical protein